MATPEEEFEAAVAYGEQQKFLAAIAYGEAQKKAASQPSASELAEWNNQRREVSDVYGDANAQNDFDRSQALAQQSYETADLAKQWNRQREALPGQYAHRGLLNSGIYGEALQHYGEDRTSASSALALKYQQTLGNIGLAQQRAQGAYGRDTASVDSTEAARRQDLASQLKGVV